MTSRNPLGFFPNLMDFDSQSTGFLFLPPNRPEKAHSVLMIVNLFLKNFTPQVLFLLIDFTWVGVIDATSRWPKSLVR
jgi:hypothetical protein